MIWYLLNIAIISLAYFWPEREEALEAGFDVSYSKRKRVCTVGTISWIILSGLRHVSIGADTERYKYAFEIVKHQSWNRIFGDLYDRYFQGVDIKDPGYPIFEKLCQVFSDSYQVFLVIIATIFFVALGIFIFKLSSNPYLSYILFSTLFYSFFAITGHRQTIATAFVVLLGSFLIKKRKFIPFLIVVLLASTIHLSCLCFLPFYFISRLKINKATMVMYWIAIILSFIYRYELMELLQSIIGYDQYGDYEGAKAGTFMYLLIALAVVVTVFHKRLLASSPENMRISINALMLACFFAPLLLINQSTMRVVQYFSLFLMLVLPELGQIFAKKTDKKLYTLFATILLMALLVSNQPVYKFFWQH